MSSGQCGQSFLISGQEPKMYKQKIGETGVQMIETKIFK